MPSTNQVDGGAGFNYSHEHVRVRWRETGRGKSNRKAIKQAVKWATFHVRCPTPFLNY